MLGPALFLDTVDDLLDVLRPLFGHDQDDVVGGDDDQVLDTDDGDQVPITPDIAVVGVQDYRVAEKHVALGVAVADFP
jgi:hypothetical protein